MSITAPSGTVEGALAEWTLHRLGDPEVSDIVMGQSPPSETYNREGVGLPFFQGKVDFGLRHPAKRLWCSSPVKKAREGDVLISVRAPVGDVNLATEPCCIGRGLAALRAGSLADSEFLFYLLMHHKSALDTLGSGAIFKAVNRETLRSFELLLPPPNEQRAIAGVLAKLQARVEVQDRIIATLKELKAATMAKLFREGLRGERLKQTEIGEIPESWEVVRLGSVVEPVSGGTPSKARPEWWQGSIPWASPKDMKTPRLFDAEDHISAEALAEGSRLVPPKTIFVVTRGMILAKDLPVAISEVPMAFNQDMRALLPTGAIDPDFLLYAITAHKEALRSSIGTSAHGTRRLGSASLEALLVPKPTRDEQKRIASILARLDRREEIASEAATAHRGLFAEALGILMTGQLRLRS